MGTDVYLDLVKGLREAFPKDAEIADGLLFATIDLKAEEHPYTWLEQFSQVTTDAIANSDYAKVTSHLQFIESVLSTASAETIRAIDVAYVEALMWNVKNEERKANGWKLFPPAVRKLYIAEWGSWPFMDCEHDL